MGGRKIHFCILLIVLLSIGLGECAPRLGRRNRKRQGILGAVVGSAVAIGVKKMIKHKTTTTPPPQQLPALWPAAAESPFQQYQQMPFAASPSQGIQPTNNFQVGYGPNGQSNNNSFPFHPQSNQTTWGAPAYPPNSIFPVAPATPFQPQGPPVQYNPAPGSPVQMPPQPVAPIVVATNPTPKPQGRNSASTFSFSLGYIGFGALVGYMISSRSRF